MCRCLLLDRDALLSCRLLLRCAAELGTILLWFFVADRTNAIAAGEKVGCLFYSLFDGKGKAPKALTQRLGGGEVGRAKAQRFCMSSLKW